MSEWSKGSILYGFLVGFANGFYYFLIGKELSVFGLCIGMVIIGLIITVIER